MIKLTPRLQAIADKIPVGMTVADVGTDHGYLPAWLVQNDRCTKAWACDLQEGPLKNAQETIEKEDLSECIELRLGPGLRPMAGEKPDAVVIAGMGGLLIAEILGADPLVAQQCGLLALQPMSCIEDLRKWLVTHNYAIVDEQLVQEGRRMYEIIFAKFGEAQPQNDVYDLVGYTLHCGQDPLYRVFLQNHIKRLDRIIKEAENAVGSTRREECMRLKEKIEEMMTCV